LAEDVFDVDAAGEAAQRVGGSAEVFGAKFGFVRVALQEDAEMMVGVGDEGALAGVRQGGGQAAVVEAIFGNGGEARGEVIEALAGLG
jgi:hypothetical protein